MAITIFTIQPQRKKLQAIYNALPISEGIELYKREYYIVIKVDNHNDKSRLLTMCANLYMSGEITYLCVYEQVLKSEGGTNI